MSLTITQTMLAAVAVVFVVIATALVTGILPEFQAGINEFFGEIEGGLGDDASREAQLGDDYTIAKQSTASLSCAISRVAGGNPALGCEFGGLTDFSCQNRGAERELSLAGTTADKNTIVNGILGCFESVQRDAWCARINVTRLQGTISKTEIETSLRQSETGRELVASALQWDASLSGGITSQSGNINIISQNGRIHVKPIGPTDISIYSRGPQVGETGMYGSCVECGRGESGAECLVRNFNLPQEISDAKKWIAFYGDPQFLVYFQNFPLEEDTWTFENDYKLKAAIILISLVPPGKIVKMSWRMGRAVTAGLTDRMLKDVVLLAIKNDLKRLTERRLIDLARATGSWAIHSVKRGVVLYSAASAAGALDSLFGSKISNLEPKPNSVILAVPHEDDDVFNVDTNGLPVVLQWDPGVSGVGKQEKNLHFASPCSIEEISVYSQPMECGSYEYDFETGAVACLEPDFIETSSNSCLDFFEYFGDEVPFIDSRDDVEGVDVDDLVTNILTTEGLAETTVQSENKTLERSGASAASTDLDIRMSLEGDCENECREHFYCRKWKLHEESCHTESGYREIQRVSCTCNIEYIDAEKNYRIMTEDLDNNGNNDELVLMVGDREIVFTDSDYDHNGLIDSIKLEDCEVDGIGVLYSQDDYTGYCNDQRGWWTESGGEVAGIALPLLAVAAGALVPGPGWVAGALGVAGMVSGVAVETVALTYEMRGNWPGSAVTSPPSS